MGPDPRLILPFARFAASPSKSMPGLDTLLDLISHVFPDTTSMIYSGAQYKRLEVVVSRNEQAIDDAHVIKMSTDERPFNSIY